MHRPKLRNGRTASWPGGIRHDRPDCGRPSGAVVAAAAVEIQNPVSHYDQTAKTDNQGTFIFNNVPYNNYHATAVASAFQSAEQDVDVRSPVPAEVKFSLKVGTANTSVKVEAAADLVETDPEIHTDVDRNLFNKLPPREQLLFAN